ncbi:hypothetical protein HMPREF3201_02180 [Megasphaera sp. MJR8396C]|nr:hypothetical protein HMPREF3201_02180 [Megasphaera sp. MJR8396C]
MIKPPLSLGIRICVLKLLEPIINYLIKNFNSLNKNFPGYF